MHINHFNIPPAPLNPLTDSFEHADSHTKFLAGVYRAPGMSQLIQALNPVERKELEKDILKLDNRKVTKFCEQIKSGKIPYDPDNMREITVTALKALFEGKITVNQVTSLHSLDGAFRKENNLSYAELEHLYFDAKYTEILPIKTFFNFTDEEWDKFCHIMNSESIPLSEKHFYLIPTENSHSLLTKRIFYILKLFHPISFDSTEKAVIPSFTMFQKMSEIKAQTVGRSPITYVPTYNLLKPGAYSMLKMSNLIPVCYYFPEADPSSRYNPKNPEYLRTVDGYAKVGPWATENHDLYHGLRELQLSEIVALARHRLAGNCYKDESSAGVLTDGEMNVCDEKQTCFKLDFISSKFGYFLQMYEENLFKIGLGFGTTINSFIKDMVHNPEDWKRTLQIDKEDLLEGRQQELYD